MQGGTRPLVLLDGIEILFENLTTIDLTQVERVEVVQGAASATLYGAQGANGVIQIFSKKGSKGRLSINVSSSYGQNSYINAGNFGKASLHPYLTDANGTIVNAGSNSGLGYEAGDPVCNRSNHRYCSRFKLHFIPLRIKYSRIINCYPGSN